jgi:GDP-4-dehydro-6-deoxy-D-mannose reductase
MIKIRKEPRKAFVTGLSGFVGNHLTNHLSEKGWKVTGYDQRRLHTECDFYAGDLSDTLALGKALEVSAPAVIFHLAGILKSESHEDFYNVHVLGTISLLDTVVAKGLSPTVIIASSSAVYGPGIGRKPITEGFELRPQTHYALSKAAQEMAALRYYHAYGLPVICTRTFNLLGPGLSPQMACSSFAQQIALAEKIGHPAVISTGDLRAKRDFVDVRDAVRAYAMLAEQGKPGDVYNVCSGEAVSIRDCLDILLKQARVPVEVVLDPAKVQKNDVPIQVGSTKKLKQRTGWEPKISVEQSLIDLLNDWRQRIEMEKT